MNPDIIQWRSLSPGSRRLRWLPSDRNLGTVAVHVSQILRKDMQHLLSEQQFSTVSFLAANVDREVNERLNSLKSVARGIGPDTLGNPAALQAFLEQRPVLQGLFNGGTFATGKDGTTIASLPLSADRIGVNFMDRDHIVGALIEGKATIGKPVMNKPLKAPLVTMAVPIRDVDGKVIGALTGTIDLGKPGFLDKILGSHYGEGGSYRLVAPQFRLIVSSSDKSQVMKTLPAPGINPAADRFLQGFEGSAVALDPLGGQMLVSVKGIPAAGWILGATLPIEEAFAPIRTLQQRMLLTTIFLTLLVGVLAWWIVRRQLAPMFAAIKTLATMSVNGQSMQPLPIAREDEIGELIGGFNRLLETLRQREESLRESEERFRSLTEMSSDFYWESDAEHRITQRTENRRDFTQSLLFGAPPIGKRRWEVPCLSPMNQAGKNIVHCLTHDCHSATLRLRG